MIHCWLQEMYRKIYPVGNKPAGAFLRLDAARNESTAFQVAVVNTALAVAKVKIAVKVPRGIDARIRRVGFVPLPHHNTDVPVDELDCRGHVPGYVPDPLFDEDDAQVAPREAAGFWISVRTAADCRPGPHKLIIVVKPEGCQARKLLVRLQVYPLVLEPRRHFPVIQWFYNDALLDWYHFQPFEDGFWKILERYLRDLPAHGQDTVLVPLCTPPTDGVKRPTQLLRVTTAGKRYRFDWRDVKRYVALARRCGLCHLEWNHFFSQWGAQYAIRVYCDQGREEKLLWNPETPATAPVYRNFLRQLLPELHQFLIREKLLKDSFFHVSDEPHTPEHKRNYKVARAVLRELAPWMKTMDALSEIAYGREKLTDMPIPHIGVTKQFYEEGIKSFTYFCCGPRGRYLNRLIDTPLIKIRMSGWLFYRFKALGFLHWGYNYWYKSQTRTLIDPFTESAGQWCHRGWAYGDPFLVYPGAEGPVDSIRWEIFSLSLQDYALLQTAGIDPEGPFLARLRDFNDFPKDLRWFQAARKKLLAGQAR
ncbi:MAG: DUF4091 domain-containing protein [Lentisphaerae bacterium]|nr:DUF4091 domain-containing protein [Lentisphaerota bacterium]